MRFADYILLAAIAACFIAALAYTIHRRKSGGCMGCGSAGSCSVNGSNGGRADRSPGNGCAGCSLRDGCSSCSGCSYAAKDGCVVPAAVQAEESKKAL